MTTTTTADPYASVRESPGFADLAAFQAGETDTFPQTGWEKSCAAQYARRDAERDARWTAMRAWLEHWAESARATMREHENSGVRFSLALCQTALDEMTRLEQAR